MMILFLCPIVVVIASTTSTVILLTTFIAVMIVLTFCIYFKNKGIFVRRLYCLIEYLFTGKIQKQQPLNATNATIALEFFSVTNEAYSVTPISSDSTTPQVQDNVAYQQTMFKEVPPVYETIPNTREQLITRTYLISASELL